MRARVTAQEATATICTKLQKGLKITHGLDLVGTPDHTC